MKNKVVFFEIPASNFEQAKAFYERVFDWKVELSADEGAMAARRDAASTARAAAGSTGEFMGER